MSKWSKVPYSPPVAVESVLTTTVHGRCWAWASFVHYTRGQLHYAKGELNEAAKEFAAASKRSGNGKGITLSPLNRTIDDSGIRYGFVSVDIDRAARIATISIKAPEAAPPANLVDRGG